MSRLIILTESEQQEYDYPPILTTEAKAVCFSINDTLNGEIKRLRGTTNKVGFLLQYAYFKACKRFFTANRFRIEDVEYAAKLLSLPLCEVNLGRYKERTPIKHQEKILALFEYKTYASQEDWVEKEVIARIERILDPRTLFLDILHLLHENHVEIPTYHTLTETITEHYLNHENQLLSCIDEHLTDAQRTTLASLTQPQEFQKAFPITQFKTVNQSLKPKSIQASINLFRTLNEIFEPLVPFITKLQLTPESCQHHAIWVKKAKLSQLKQFTDERKLYLRLSAFVQHQYFIRQDNFIDIFLRSVQSSKNAVTQLLQEKDTLTRAERRNAVQHLTKTRKQYRELIDEITEITKSSALTDSGKVQKISELLEAHSKTENEKEKKKVALLEKSLDNMAKNKDYFDVLEKSSIKLQNRVSSILKVLVFNPENSDKDLLKAINHFNEKDGEISQTAPTEFLKPDELEAVHQENKNFRVSLYKILLFIHINDAIKSGNLNLKYSHRYLAIQDYLIDKNTWLNDRDTIINQAMLGEFTNYEEVMKRLKLLLDEKYHSVNQRVLNGTNPYIGFNDDRTQVTTPALAEKETKHISAFLNQVGYVPILQILTDIDQVTGFSQTLKHHSLKNAKLKPQKSIFYAGIIGLGCNIGIPKMSQISSGINQNTMMNTVNWYFNLTTLNAANERIRMFINRLALPHVFAENETERHGSSDGRKVGVAIDCLLATYSFKYFGKDKGVSIYTFIDDRNVLFHHQVMSSSEREAAYVIDGLNNINVPKIDIHSTDTHGFTELIFAATHLLNTTYAPRIKNIGKQCIYAFSSKKIYQKLGYKILPSRPIQQKLIQRHWDDVLRFMATIRLNKVSASQLFKRLSSYAKNNPLYKG